MTFVPNFMHVRNSIVKATGCTDQDADVAMRREGINADLNILCQSAELEVKIRACREMNIDPVDALQRALITGDSRVTYS